MWFQYPFIQAYREGKQCFHGYSVKYFVGAFEEYPNLCIKFECWDIFLKPHLVVVVLTLEQTRAVTVYYRLGIDCKVVNKAILRMHLVPQTKLTGVVLLTFSWYVSDQTHTFLASRVVLFQCKNLNEGKIWGHALLKALFASYTSAAQVVASFVFQASAVWLSSFKGWLPQVLFLPALRKVFPLSEFTVCRVMIFTQAVGIFLAFISFSWYLECQGCRNVISMTAWCKFSSWSCRGWNRASRWF